MRDATVSSFLSLEKNQQNRQYPVADEPPRAFKDMSGLQIPFEEPDHESSLLSGSSAQRRIAFAARIPSNATTEADL
jgi:hypothetical protein